MSIRKLASIQRILSIGPIEGADAIEVATVNSWKVVVKKGEFKVGDLVIYCEVDSWIPTELAPFLSKGKEPREYEGIKGEQLRTVKLRGQVSQGLILPTITDRTGTYIMIYDDWETGNGEYSVTVTEGMDVTNDLGIVKYEPPVPAQLAGVVKGSWPSSVPKTDEERIQNLTNEWPELAKAKWELTEKLEGSSMTVGRINGEFLVCSRNLNLKETEGNTLWAVARKHGIEQKMIRAELDNFVIQGELIGEGVQGNHYKIKVQEFYVYSMYDIEAGEYVSSKHRTMIVESMGLPHVPVIAFSAHLRDTLGITSIEDVLKFADRKSKLNPNVLAEGVVFKEIDGQRHWKAVSNEYLLKHG